MKKVLAYLLVLPFCLTPVAEMSAQCEFGEHSTESGDSWISCEMSANPNPVNGSGHWIMYDMGAIYEFFASHIWNYNEEGQTDLGVRNCLIEVSTNGQDWESVGTFEIPEAPGDDDYFGVTGPNFGGAIGRYILITIQSTWGLNDCAGFAEIQVFRDFLSTGLEEHASLIAVEVFPNPASETLIVRQYEQGSLELKVFDLSGRILWDTSTARTTNYVDVSTWSEGMYVLTLTDATGQTASRRFVVAH